MKNAKWLVFLAIMMPLFLLFSVKAETTISSCNLSAEIIESKAFIVQSIVLESYSETDFSIILPKDAKILSFQINKEQAIPSVTETESKKELQISQNTKEAEIKFISNSVLDKADKSYFTYDIGLPFFASNIEIKLILPEQAVLDTKESAYPSPTEKITDGQRITLTWRGQNKTNFPVFVIFKEQKEFDWIYQLIILLIIIALAIYFLLKKNIIKNKHIKRSRKKAKKKVKKTIKDEVKELHLLPSEESVVKVLKEEKGEMWQKQIQLKTGFSKAKLSRTIRNLESRGLIKRIPLGNTNKIRLM